jgi:alkanesulfonate monooxygenase SsuD/methylene tetrahydromethanopterin reductase-like flavin-dependent oxidoreductase (luciferase family)
VGYQRMQRAISLPPVGPPHALVELAVTAEANGWDGVFIWDHLHFLRAMGVDVVDPWVTLGAIAAATTRVRIGPMVTPLPRRRPWVVAKELVTVDQLSNGRAIFGAGIGFPPEDEFASFGEPTSGRVRADMLDEGLDLLDHLMRGEPVKHDGVNYHVDAHLRPASVQQPRPPFWLAGTDPYLRPLRRAARWDGVAPIAADGGPMRPDELARYVARVEPPARFDIIGGHHPDHQAGEYEAVGATWLMDSRWPAGDWFAELSRVAHGPPPS